MLEPFTEVEKTVRAASFNVKEGALVLNISLRRLLDIQVELLNR